jgi:hypothetical protein
VLDHRPTVHQEQLERGRRRQREGRDRVGDAGVRQGVDPPQREVRELATSIEPISASRPRTWAPP